MRAFLRLSVSFAFLGFVLACAGGDKEDDGTAGTTGGQDVVALDQTDACADYVSCAGVVAPEGMGALLETYGPSGSCWTQGQETADLCDQACAAAYDDLAALYPEEPACGGSPSGCVFEEGYWTFTFAETDRDCPMSLDGEEESVVLTCTDTGTGTFEATNSWLVFACTSSGQAFSCLYEVEDRISWLVEGSFAASGTTGSGTFEYWSENGADDCEIEGTVALEW